MKKKIKKKSLMMKMNKKIIKMTNLLYLKEIAVRMKQKKKKMNKMKMMMIIC
jgi:hypothetical protein